MSKIVNVWNVGKISYGKGLKLQKYISSQHLESKQFVNTLLCFEHTPVYTTGIRTNVYSVEEEERLKRTGAEFYRTNRGGLITFHGPGQLVVYPILNLKDFKPSMKWYISHIEQTVISLCKKLGLKASTSPHTGVWINNDKVCAIGVHGSRYITTHGLALNCTLEMLDWFKHIVPCGIQGKGVTSLSKELNSLITVEEATSLFLDSFSNIFDCSYIHIDGNICKKMKNS